MNDAETSFYSVTPAVIIPSMRRASDDLADDERLFGEYTMTTIAFDAMESDALWLENMRDLVHGRSDRAVRHVALQLERQQRENPPVAWKATRKPFYSVEVLEISWPVDAKTLASKPDAGRQMLQHMQRGLRSRGRADGASQ
ncbi:hypothetical protein LTR29_009028 [Friedmanniomyces endolithicus]|nr:hypothetical protein LTR29_009028 [Friedmanniomyces endolithicus]